MSIEEELAQTLASQIAKDIDREILDTLLISVLVSEGWTATKIAPKVGLIAINKWYDETLEWIRLNVSDEYKLLNGQWLFKNQKDAIMFILRWS